MTRWIVAGVVVAVLIGLIVMDEMAFEATGPELAQTPDAANPEVPPPPPEPIDPVAEAAEAARREAEPACTAVVAVLEAELGPDKRNDVGDALYRDKGLTPEQVAALCTSLQGKPAEEVVAKMLEASGISR